MFSKMFQKKPELILSVSAVIEKDENGSFHAFAPALKGLHVDGKTEEEAAENLVQAVMVYMTSLAVHGDPLPVGPDLRVREEIHVPAGALLRNLTVQWPSLQMSGIR